MNNTNIEHFTHLVSLSAGPLAVHSLDEAFAFCRRQALGHYENFPVGSALIPRKQRPDVFAIYAFARMADDIADELTERPEDERIQLLDCLEQNLEIAFDGGQTNNPVLMALSKSMHMRQLPPEPFRKLLTAFRRDINFTQARNWEDHLDYCSYSANPVGELILRLFGLYNANTAPLSDMICSGLQLANFWQDFSRDLPAGRCFVPQDMLERYGLTIESLGDENNKVTLRQLLNELYDKTYELLDQGTALVPQLKPWRLRLEIGLTARGGKLILKKTKQLGVRILSQRPAIAKSEFARLLFQSLTGR